MSTRPTIGFLGPAPLTNGCTAATRFAAHLTGSAEPWTVAQAVEFRTHPDIVQAQAAGEIDYGVIAVENTLDGTIIESIRELQRLFEDDRERRTHVCWEELLPIRHLLLSQTGRAEDVRRIYSHPSALRQCSRFLQALQRKRPEIEITPVTSTGQGAKEAAADATVAGIGPAEALTHYEGRLREITAGQMDAAFSLGLPQTERLTDFGNGLTRFWVVGARTMPKAMEMIRVKVRDSGGQVTGTQDRSLQKTCCLLNLPDRPGSLHETVGKFAKHRLQLSVIYPYPRAEKTFEYMFFAEIEGHETDDAMRQAVGELNEGTAYLPENRRPCIVLGSFPNTTLLQQHPEHRRAYREKFYPAAFPWRD